MDTGWIEGGKTDDHGRDDLCGRNRVHGCGGGFHGCVRDPRGIWEEADKGVPEKAILTPGSSNRA